MAGLAWSPETIERMDEQPPPLTPVISSVRFDPVYRPYRDGETDLVPPDPAEPFEPGCDRCGGLPTRYAIGEGGARYRLCLGHMATELSNRYHQPDPRLGRLLFDTYRRWAR